MSEKEIWKDVVGYEGVYEVSNMGRVKRVGKYRNQCAEWDSNHILRPGHKDNEYLFVNLSKEGKNKIKYVHRLVAEAFLPNPKNKATVNHIDGDRTNNVVENLEWATYKENNNHSLYVLGNEKSVRKKKYLCTEERLEILREQVQKKQKPVIQYDLHGNFIKEYPSYREAERETGIKAIDVVCRGDRQKGRKQQTAGGYKWKYKEDVIQD